MLCCPGLSCSHLSFLTASYKMHAAWVCELQVFVGLDGKLLVPCNLTTLVARYTDLLEVTFVNKFKRLRI